jgi:phage protein U
MYAQLGDIKFELITYFDGLDASKKIDYAEHETIEGKPKLQYIGENLEEITLKLSFHADFCNPQEELKKIKEAASLYQPLPFIFGNGLYKGKYVIEEIKENTLQSLEDATILAIEAEIRLKEWVEDKPLGVKKAPGEKIKRSNRTKKNINSGFDKGNIVRQK